MFCLFRATLKHGIREPEYGTRIRGPESGNQIIDIENDDINNSLRRRPMKSIYSFICFVVDFSFLAASTTNYKFCKRKT